MRFPNTPRPRGYLIWILGGLLLISAALNFWLGLLSVRGITMASNFQLLDPIRNFYSRDDLIINIQPLRDYLSRVYEADSSVSMYFEYLPTGANIAISKDAEFYPASLVKLPIAMAVAKKIERGDWKWTNELVLLPSDRNIAFGKLYQEPSNTPFPIEELVRLSLSESDNTAHFILLRNLEVQEVEEVYDHVGLKGFLKTDGSLSAKRYSAIFRSLYNSSYLTEEHSQKLLSFMTRSSYREFIQSALPEGIVFSHKIGIEKEHQVFLDSGIVYAKRRPYILTIMVRTEDRERAKAVMKDISEKVYNYVSGYKADGE